MNKEQLVEKLAAKTGMTKKGPMDAINPTRDTITASLRKGEKVTLVGFGTFLVRRRAAREGRNPQTGARIRIPARKGPAFTAGKELKAAIKEARPGGRTTEGGGAGAWEPQPPGFC